MNRCLRELVFARTNAFGRGPGKTDYESVAVEIPGKDLNIGSFLKQPENVDRRSEIMLFDE